MNLRPTRAVVDLDAVRSNVAALCAVSRPAVVCAVVKADGYGHGAVAVAHAALDGGATWLAVALVEEGIALRDAGIDAPILLLSEPPRTLQAAQEAVRRRLDVTVYSIGAIDRLQAAAEAAGTTIGVHLKIDTGMHRVGAQPDDLVTLARHIDSCPSVRLAGTCTHLAVADAPSNPYTARQLAAFDTALSALEAEGIAAGVVHAANSAGAIGHPAARRTMVRCGITVYGLAPDADFDPSHYGVTLRPALSLRSEVSHVKVLPAGEGISYGLIRSLVRPTAVATVPIGYADGVARRLSSVGGEVLIGGRRCEILGRVTMDQLLVDAGPASESTVARGDEVVLIGCQGDEEISVWEWATRLDTIAYEITCGLSARVPRAYVG